MKVVYLGFIGLYLYEAVRRFFGKEREKFIVCEIIDDVFEIIEENRVEFGVVFVENFIEGSVLIIFDYLLKFQVYIVKEIVLKVEYYFCVREEKE